MKSASIKRGLALILTAMLISGCSVVPKKSLIEADENMVKSCTFVGSFEASNWQRDTARQIVINQAASRGASHILFEPVIIQASDASTGFKQYLVTGKGYMCNR